MDIWSDIAYFYETQNFFEAVGDVVVMQGDSLQLNSEYIEYSGTTKFAVAKRIVHIQHQESSLRTDYLYFDLKKQEEYYKPREKSQVMRQ